MRFNPPSENFSICSFTRSSYGTRPNFATCSVVKVICTSSTAIFVTAAGVSFDQKWNRIFCRHYSLGSTTVTESASKAIEFGEMTQNKELLGHRYRYQSKTLFLQKRRFSIDFCSYATSAVTSSKIIQL